MTKIKKLYERIVNDGQKEKNVKSKKSMAGAKVIFQTPFSKSHFPHTKFPPYIFVSRNEKISLEKKKMVKSENVSLK